MPDVSRSTSTTTRGPESRAAGREQNGRAWKRHRLPPRRSGAETKRPRSSIKVLAAVSEQGRPARVTPQQDRAIMPVSAGKGEFEQARRAYAYYMAGSIRAGSRYTVLLIVSEKKQNRGCAFSRTPEPRPSHGPSGRLPIKAYLKILAGPLAIWLAQIKAYLRNHFRTRTFTNTRKAPALGPGGNCASMRLRRRRRCGG